MKSWLIKHERIIKNGLGGLFLGAVTWEYFQNHIYYTLQADSLKGVVAILVGWALITAGILAYRYLNKKNTWTITPLRAFLGALALIWVTGMGLFLYLDPAVLTEPYQVVFYDEGQMAVVDLNKQLAPGVTAELKQGSIVRDWRNIKGFFPENLHPLFTYLNPIQFGGRLFVNLLKQAGYWLMLTILFFGLGSTAWRRPSLTAWGVLESIGLGMGLMMLGLFLLGAFGFLSTVSVWILAGVALGVGLPQTWRLAKWVVTQKTTIDFKAYPKWMFLVGGMLGVVVSLNLIDSIIPMSVGFDSIHVYHNVPKLMTQYNALVPGFHPYNYGLLMSMPLFMFGGNVASIATVVFGFLLVLAASTLLLKKVFKAPYAVLALALFCVLPVVNFMLHIDLKTDLPLLFFHLLAIGQVIQWDQARDKPKSSKKHLLATGLWLGIGLGIKYTTFYLAATLLAFIAVRHFVKSRQQWQGLVGVALLTLGGIGLMGYRQWLTSFSGGTQVLLLIGLILVGGGLLGYAAWRQKCLKKMITQLAMVGGVMGLLLVPWLTYNAVQAETLSVADIFFGESRQADFEPESFGMTAEACSFGSTYDEIGRYTGNFEGHSLLVPWVAMWEAGVNNAYANNRLVDIGPYFLGFAVFVLVGYRRLRREKDSEHWRWLAVLSGFYLILWALTGTGIVWFALSLLMGLIVLYVRLWKSETWALVAVMLMMTTMVMFRVQDSINHSESLLFAGGVTNEAVYLEQGTDGTVAFREMVNTPNVLDKYVYAVGGFLRSDVQYNDQRYIMDQFLEAYDCYFDEGTPEDILQRFRVANIEFVILTTTGLAAEGDTGGPLHQRYFEFKAFADEHMTIELVNADMILYRIPST